MKYASTAMIATLAAGLLLGCAPMEPAETKDSHCTPTQPMKAEAPQTPTLKCECTTEQIYKQECPCDEKETALLTPYEDIRINVIGQGVAPTTTISPAQAYALAKRAAISDAYRLLAEKVKGVRVEGQDLIQNMMVKRSTVKTYVDARIRDAQLVETNFKEGLCEVEMELVLSHSAFIH